MTSINMTSATHRPLIKKKINAYRKRNQKNKAVIPEDGPEKIYLLWVKMEKISFKPLERGGE